MLPPAIPRDAPPAAGVDISIFNPEEILRNVGNNQKLLIKTLEHFVLNSTSTSPISALLGHVADGEYGRATRAAHKLKGMFGYLCAHRAREVAHRVETAAKQLDEPAALERASSTSAGVSTDGSLGGLDATGGGGAPQDGGASLEALQRALAELQEETRLVHENAERALAELTRTAAQEFSLLH